MTVRSSGNIIRLIYFLLILLSISGSAYSQTVISGNIKNVRGPNWYPHSAVTAIVAANKMTVSDPSGFISGDTVLVIQMQGVGIYTVPYGQYGTKFGEPGLWEFIIVSSVAGNELTFTNNLKGAYDIKGNIQIVNVPAFPNVTIGGLSDLTCDPWDPVTKSGGVLAIIVGNTLKLQRNIDVSANGFKGGAGALGDGICQITNASYQADAYADSYTNAGWKGEGIAVHALGGGLLLPTYAKGKGHNFTSGGGGNGRYSGGGGGSHRGTGGTGGSELNTCPTPLSGGNGGIVAEYNPDLLNRIFMGGGGGASTRSATGTAGSGGDGGGIVIIITNTIAGDGGHILARGGNGGNGGGTGASGAGGGGAGGTIALSVLNYSGTAFDANVEGGNGGDNPSPRLYGEGGGGGAGLVWLAVDNALVSTKLSGGLAGTSDNQQASDGTSGEKRASFNPNLNGFLFNSVRSSVTQMPVDTSCSNMKPPKILGTQPVGGTAPFIVTWQRSRDNFATSDDVATGAALWDYTPVLDDTLKRSGPIYFRRIIVDSSIPTQLTDISLPVVIEIQPSIKKYLVGPPDTICFANNPPTVGPLSAPTGGDNTYSYKWMVSTVNGTSGFTAPGSNTGASYTPPPALMLDSWYRRTIYSGRCVDSTAVVKIEVLENISGNAITSALAEEICDGMNFSPVTATVTPAITGGDGTYRYKWISSANSWGAAPDAYTNPGYAPVAGSFALGTQVSLRRVIFSGIHDVCKDTTTIVTAVKLTRWPVIINNNITAAQTIGYDSVPAPLTENPVPGISGGAGAGSYLYTWQIGPGWVNAPGVFNQTGYQPDSLKITTAFRRYVASSACTSISNTVTITVHPPITNTISLNVPANDTIATASSPGTLLGSVPTGGDGANYSYKWYRSLTGSFVAGDLIAGATTQSIDPGNLTAAGSSPVSYYFRRDVSSPIITPTSTYKSNIIKVVVLPVLAGYDINGSAAKCSGQIPDLLQGKTPVTGGDGKYKYTWQDSTSGHNFADIPNSNSANYQPPSLATGAAYRRIVYSTANNYTLQSATSNIVRVTVYQLPAGSIINMDTIKVCDTGSPTSVPIKVNFTPSAAPWTVVFSDSVGANLTRTVTSLATSPTVSPASPNTTEFRYKLVSVKDVHGCDALPASLSGFQIVKVNRKPTPLLVSPADQEICGGIVKLSASAPAFGTGGWLYPDMTGVLNINTSAYPLTTTISVDSSALQLAKSFKWKVINGVCDSSVTATVRFDKRTSEPLAGADTLIFSLSGDITLKGSIKAQPLVGSGTWTMIPTLTAGSIEKKDEYISIVRDIDLPAPGDSIAYNFRYSITNGVCLLSDDKIIRIKFLTIPDAFSPNQDAWNNEFEIKGIDPVNDVLTLKIMNSAGTEVYSTTNKNGNTWTNWNGENKKGDQLPEGTYYYLLLIENGSGVNKFSGFVILKRSI